MRDLPENPWTPPATTSLEASIADGVWREGDEVVMLRSAELPLRCIHCNAPVFGRPRRQWLYWHRPGWYLLLVLNFVVYLLVAIVIRESAVIRPGLCRWHRRRRTAALIMGFVALIAMLRVAFSHAGSVEVLLGGVAIGFLVIVVTAWIARTLRPSRIDGHTIRLKGAGAAFLASLPTRAPQR